MPLVRIVGGLGDWHAYSDFAKATFGRRRDARPDAAARRRLKLACLYPFQYICAMKAMCFLGNSLEALRGFPECARQDVG